VRGNNFKSCELVRVVAQVEGRHVKTVRATAIGVFTVRFPVSVQECTGYIVRATGSKRAATRTCATCPSRRLTAEKR
jgi:hypothetical protein